MSYCQNIVIVTIIIVFGIPQCARKPFISSPRPTRTPSPLSPACAARDIVFPPFPLAAHSVRPEDETRTNTVTNGAASTATAAAATGAAAGADVVATAVAVPAVAATIAAAIVIVISSVSS